MKRLTQVLKHTSSINNYKCFKLNSNFLKSFNCFKFTSQTQKHSFSTTVCGRGSWVELNLNKDLNQALENIGLTETNEVQDKSIPKIIKGQDVVLTAETGSGKTIAPIIQKLALISDQDVPSSRLPLGIILIPNKELIWQVASVAKTISSLLPNDPIDVIFDRGNIHSSNSDKKRILLIATPSSLAKKTQSELMTIVRLSREARFIVIDEMDLLLSGSYGGKTQQFLAQLIKKENFESENFKRQFIFVGASLNPSSSRKAIRTYINKKFPTAKFINTKKVHQTVDNLEETFIHSPRDLVQEACFDWKSEQLIIQLKDLFESIKDLPSSSIPQIALAFCSDLKGVESLYETLKSRFDITDEILCLMFHKKVPREDREDMLKFLKFGPGVGVQLQVPKAPKLIIVATTDLLSRGLDLENLDNVFQVDFPTDISTYLHRAGRTARAGRSGKVTSFITPDDYILSIEIENAAKDKVELQAQNQTEAVDPKLENLFSRRRSLNRKFKAKSFVKAIDS